MQLTTAHVEKLRNLVRNEPLEKNEIRRVVGAGEQYISLSAAVIDEKTYIKMYELSIDGKSHAISAKIAKK